MIDGFNWILPERLAGSGLPGLLNDLEVDLLWLRSSGIRHVISLTEKPLALAATPPAGLEFHHFPIVDMGIPTPRDTHRLCDFILRAIERDEAVLVHCKAGLGRTGTVLACCLVSQGATAEEAIVRLRSICTYYIQNHTQESLVRHYAEFASEQSLEGLPDFPFLQVSSPAT